MIVDINQCLRGQIDAVGFEPYGAASALYHQPVVPFGTASTEADRARHLLLH